MDERTEAAGTPPLTRARGVAAGQEGSATDAESKALPGEARQRRRVWWGVAALSLTALALAGATRLGAFDGEGGDSSPTRPGQVPTVRTALAKKSSLRLGAEYRGDLVAEGAELSSQVTGRVMEIRVDLGDHFKKGDLLARIDATQAQRQVAEARTQVSSANAALQRARAELAAAELELQRGQSLHVERLISDQELDARTSAVAVARAQVATAQAQQTQAAARVSLFDYEASETRLVAPFDGAVADRYLDPGSLVQPGARVLRLVHDGPLRVRFRIPERDLSHVAQGMPLEVTTQATGAQRFAGTLTRRSAEVSQLDRSVTVEGVLDADTVKLLPGMYATVHLELGRLDDVVVVPSEAIVERPTREGVRTGLFVVDGDVAKWHNLSVLGSSEDLTAVKPLEPGTMVVTLGPDTLRDGASVRVAEDDGP